MTQNEDGKTLSFPGTVATLTSGFELTTKHLWLMVLPVLLDLFYWLGPRIGIASVVKQYTDVFSNEPSFAQLVEPLSQLAPQINLFTNLSLPLVGIPALMSGAVPEQTPLSPVTYELQNALLWPGLFIALSLAGLALTTIYLGLIRLALKDGDDFEGEGISRFFRVFLLSFFRLLGLGITFFILTVMVIVPLLPIALVLGLLNSSLSLAVLFVGVVLVIIHLSLAVPGIVLNDRPLIRAVSESVRMVHRNMMPTLNLLLLIVVISSGMNLLWRLADDGSWLTLVSIAGHGFVSTALAAAVFIFYRDRLPTLVN